jgi:membrane protein YdbS with pleckstrin-like domain
MYVLKQLERIAVVLALAAVVMMYNIHEGSVIIFSFLFIALFYLIITGILANGIHTYSMSPDELELTAACFETNV